MKKFSLVAILLLSIPMFAQKKAESDLSFGVKGGVSFNHFSGDIPVDLTPQLRIGFTAGVFASYKLSDNFAIQPEILFVRKGSNFDEFDFFEYEGYEINGLRLDMYIESNWIEIPVLLLYRINDSLELFGGPYIGFYLNGKLVAELITQPWVSIYAVDLDYDIEADDLSLPDCGIVLGARYNLTEKLAIQGRWEYGIQDLTDEVANFLDDDVTVNNSSFQLQLDFTIK